MYRFAILSSSSGPRGPELLNQRIGCAGLPQPVVAHELLRQASEDLKPHAVGAKSLYHLVICSGQLAQGLELARVVTVVKEKEEHELAERGRSQKAV